MFRKMDDNLLYSRVCYALDSGVLSDKVFNNSEYYMRADSSEKVLDLKKITAYSHNER